MKCIEKELEEETDMPKRIDYLLSTSFENIICLCIYLSIYTSIDLAHSEDRSERFFLPGIYLWPLNRPILERIWYLLDFWRMKAEKRKNKKQTTTTKKKKRIRSIWLLIKPI